MPRKLLLLILSAALLTGLWAAPALAAEPNLTGKYEVKRALYTVRVDILQKGDKLSLVAYIHSVIGTNYTYHFFGDVEGDKVYAKHDSGHVFSGTISPKGELVGKVTTRWGSDYEIEAGPNNQVKQWSDGVKRNPPRWRDK